MTGNLHDSLDHFLNIANYTSLFAMELIVSKQIARK